ncbi:hypothetical protein SYK_31290 [Pseudodesulfovibrio nedwellii]|uniref:Uncharacterized protein n=1 Tax=Pseudodesulfovibrio nedwellii TaxID=2973072 RepID=A0ABN6S8W8_9BACT|nr:hypothetical protein [Pseudodesulfovibrio nedwellii]BDQ38769.1 hypothetical protein SYK_31290 [Pseudodesulfovibrio nedwellii]
MSRAVSREKVAEAVLAGIETAQENYCKWTGGEWLGWAPEYMMTTYIAASLSELSPIYLTMESNVKDILDSARAIGRGQLPKDIRHNGRSDIVIYYGDGDPRAIVEVKNRVYGYSETCRNDLKRISSMLNRKSGSSSLDFGIFTFFTSSTTSPAGKNKAKERVEMTLNRFKENVMEDYGYNFNVNMHRLPITTEENDAWSACCFIISNKQEKPYYSHSKRK